MPVNVAQICAFVIGPILMHFAEDRKEAREAFAHHVVMQDHMEQRLVHSDGALLHTRRRTIPSTRRPWHCVLVPGGFVSAHPSRDHGYTN